MSEITQALGTASAGHLVLLGGVEYRLTPLTKKIQGAFEDWLAARALAQTRDLRGVLDPEEYSEQLALVNDRKTSGYYAFGGKLSVRTLQQPLGITKLLHLMLLQHHPKLTLEGAEQLMQDHAEALTDAIKALVSEGKLVPSTV